MRKKGGGRKKKRKKKRKGIRNSLKIVREGRKIPGGNRENKLAFLDPAKAPPKSKGLPTQSLSRQRHAFIRMLVGCVPNGETVVTTWSTHDDVPSRSREMAMMSIE